MSGHRFFFPFFCLLLAVFSALIEQAHAWPPTYGAEFEFTNIEMREEYTGTAGATERNKQAARDFTDALRKKCVVLQCKISPVKGKWGNGYASRVMLKNGWWFQIDADPAAVEIQTKPATLEELKKLSPAMNRLIFDTAADAGLFADHETGAGHFNIGVRSAFGDNPKEFLRYFVDYANHPEFPSGVMMQDFANAPPLSALDPRQRNELTKIIQEAELGRYVNYFELTSELLRRVYPKSFEKGREGDHFQALSVKKLTNPALHYTNSDEPFELRAVYPQKSARDFTLMGELFEKRVAFLQSPNAPPLHYINSDRKAFTMQELVSRFYVYVVEAGGDWKRFRPLMGPEFAGYPPDLFLTRKPMWNSPSYIAAMKTHLRFLPTSKFLRERFLQAMKDPRSFESREGIQILQRVESAYQKSTNAAELETYRKILNEILSSTPWSENLAKLPESLRKLSGPLPLLTPANCSISFRKLR